MKTSNKEEEEPHFVKRDKFAITAEYKQWFADIKSRLRNSQIKAAIKVNSTLLEFYWSLGRDIVKMKRRIWALSLKSSSWGSTGIVRINAYFALLINCQRECAIPCTLKMMTQDYPF